MEIDTQSVRRGVINRSRATWYCYLMYGFFMYLLTIQGNIIPFLKSEFHLSYGTVSLHSSAFAAPGIVTGVFGDWLIRRYGRRRVLWLGVSGMSAGAVLLCVASAPWASIGCCALMGALGGLIWIVVTAVLAELYGDKRNVAYSEASAVAYAFGIVAPLMTSLCLFLALGWRSAVLFGVAFGSMIVLWFGWLAAGATPLSVVCTVWQLGWTERLNLWRERFLQIPKKAKMLGRRSKPRSLANR